MTIMKNPFNFFGKGAKADDKTQPVLPESKPATVSNLDKLEKKKKELIDELENIEFDRFPMSQKSDDREEINKRLGEIKHHIKNLFIVSLKRTDSADLMKLSSSKTSIFTIETSILFFIQSLNQAVLNGDIVTAESCTMGIGYGCVQAHKPIPSTMMEEIDTEMKKRSDKLSILNSIVKVSQQIAEFSNSRDKFDEQLSDVSDRYDKAWEIFDEDRKRYPKIYQSLTQMTGKAIGALTPDQLAAYKKTVSVQNLSEEKNRLVTMVKEMGIKIEQCEIEIDNLKTTFTQLNYRVDEKLKQKLEEANTVLLNKTSELQNDIFDTQSTFDRLNAEFNAILDSSDTRAMIANSAIKVASIEQKQKQLQKDEAEADINYLNATQKEIEEEEQMKRELEQKIKTPPIANKNKIKAQF